MDNANIVSAEYIYVDGVKIGVKATVDGRSLCIPLDLANRHYAEIMRQVEAGTLTIAEAD